MPARRPPPAPRPSVVSVHATVAGPRVPRAGARTRARAAAACALFDTPIGRCGIAWGAHGIVAVQLPEADDAHTCERLLDGLGTVAEAVPPPPVREAIRRIVAVLRGEHDDLRDIALDMTGISPFRRRVYEVTRAIDPGCTLTYGEVAARIGQPGAARAVGRALGLNPYAPVVPCHRVLAAGGRPGGFSALGGAATKLRMLRNEGAGVGAAPDRVQ